MTWGPVRGIAVGGILFAVFLLVSGLVLFAIGQHWIQITLNLETVCAVGLILVGLIVLGGVLFGWRMAHRSWRKWAEPWEKGWDEPREKSP